MIDLLGFKQIVAFFAFLFMGVIYSQAQPPIYDFRQVYNLNLSPDSLGDYQLIDINGDSVKDLIVATPNRIRAFNCIDGSVLIDSISCEPGFAWTLKRVSPESILVYLAYIQEWHAESTMTFRIIHFPLNNPSHKDSIFVTGDCPLGIPGPDDPMPGGFSGVRARRAAFFDFGSDGNEELIIFWSYFEAYNGGPYWWNLDSGYFSALDSNWETVLSHKHDYMNLDVDECSYLNRHYLLTVGVYSGWSHDSWGDHSYGGYSSRVYNDSLNIYADGFALIYSKILKNNDNTFQRIARYAGSQIGLSDSLNFNGSISHNMPCSAIISFYKKDSAQYILTGCPNSYFELRDMQLNLQAFIWGPSLAITNADAIDIDRDGTDELLCRTATGFVLYRLDTTNVAVNEDTKPLPETFSISAYPNPFNSAVTISFSGAGNAPISIGIYDINGRIVKSILTTNGNVLWDGSNDHGQIVSSGVYFVRATSQKAIATTRLVFLK
jgi:hypothetical protein